MFPTAHKLPRLPAPRLFRLDRTLQLGQYVKKFRKGSIDGPMLMQLTPQDLKSLLGVNEQLHRRKIMTGVQKLKKKDLLEYGLDTGTRAR